MYDKGYVNAGLKLNVLTWENKDEHLRSDTNLEMEDIPELT